MQGSLVGLVATAAVMLLSVGGTLFLLSISPVGKALAAKDFLERLLAQQREASHLPPVR